MENQFKEENIEKIPDYNKKYYCNPTTKCKSFTYLMKLVLCANNENALNLIIKELNNNPECINQQNEYG